MSNENQVSSQSTNNNSVGPFRNLAKVFGLGMLSGMGFSAGVGLSCFFFAGAIISMIIRSLR